MVEQQYPQIGFSFPEQRRGGMDFTKKVKLLEEGNTLDSIRWTKGGEGGAEGVMDQDEPETTSSFSIKCRRHSGRALVKKNIWD